MLAACPFPVPQGSQVLLKDTALALKRMGHDVHLVVYGYGIGDDHSGLTIHRCTNFPGGRKTSAGPSLMKPFQDLALLFTLHRVVREQNIDIVHAHNYEALAVALASRKRPIVYHAHNAMADELPHYFKTKKLPKKFGKWMDSTFPKRADHVIVHHTRLGTYLSDECGCDSSKISVLPPPVQDGLFDSPKLDDALPPVLYTGNLDSYQNLSLLTTVMNKVRKKIPESRLIIATHSPTRGCSPLLNAEVIHLKGLQDFKQLMAKDAVFVCPRVSWSGYPIKLLNAMAAGKAIVACKSAAYPISHQENGLIVDDDDAQAFADAVLKLMDNQELRKKLGTNARKTIEEKHSYKKVGAELERVYEDLC